MLRHLILAVAAATLVTALDPGDALAHHGYYRHHGYYWYWQDGYYWHRARFNYDLSTPDPRAGRQGFPGGHYRHDCYRAASGRAMCALLYHSL